MKKKISYWILGIVLLFYPSMIDAQYILLSENSDSIDGSFGKGLFITRRQAPNPIKLFMLDTISLNLGPKPKIDVFGSTLFGANVYEDFSRESRPKYKFVFSTFQITDTSLMLTEHFSGTFRVARGWRVWSDCDIQDHMISLIQSEHGDYDISISMALSRYEKGDIVVFFDRFRSMCRPPIPKQFRYLNVDRLLDNI